MIINSINNDFLNNIFIFYENKNLDDSYVDYVLNLETIIKVKESDDENNKTNFK